MNQEINEPSAGLLYREECYAIQGTVFEVYRELGSGFLEAVYQECLVRELMTRNIPHVAQQELSLSYKGENLQQSYKPDIICYGRIILELKAVRNISPEHRAQMFNYLRATQLRLGHLINFGNHPKVQIERIVL
jgi:GxxExxY protein